VARYFVVFFGPKIDDFQYEIRITGSSADILSDPVKRRAFDSVDPEFDNSIPKGDPKDLQKTFFNTFLPVFERNSRWAVNRSKVQKLGDMESTRDQVERFYNYWYDFKSWRDYSWEDEEDSEQAQDRYERREIEKINRVGRAKKKKEEMARIRKLVDLAWNSDPRIQAYLEEDKRKKEAAKQKKKEEARKYRENIERRQREEEEKKKAEEAAEKERLAAIEQEKKKEAKAEKNATKKERQKLRNLAKADNFWVAEDEQLKMMEQVEFLCTAFNAAKLKDLNEKLANAELKTRPQIVVENVGKHKEDEAVRMSVVSEKQNTERAKTAVAAGGWNVEDVQLLTKAMVVIPAGTLNRWDVISIWMTEHGSTKERDGKSILKKAKELERQSHRGPMDAQAAFQKYQETQDKKKLEGKKNTAEAAEASQSAELAWTQDEQKRLEQALRTYGPKEEGRWDKIAAAVPSRTKRECMLRFKQLAETAKAKKLAMAKAQKMANK